MTYNNQYCYSRISQMDFVKELFTKSFVLELLF